MKCFFGDTAFQTQEPFPEVHELWNLSYAEMSNRAISIFILADSQRV